MTALPPARIYQYAREAGLSPAAATIATAIALGESGGRPDAVGDVALQDSKWGPSIGLWQIRSVKAETGTGGTRDASRLTDPAFNARSMVAISGSGKNWNPWTVYTKGIYQQFLGQVGDATANAGNGGGWTASVDGSTPTGPGGATSPGGSSSSSSGSTESVAESMGTVMGGVFTVAMKVAGAAAAIGLVIAGALQTVKK